MNPQRDKYLDRCRDSLPFAVVGVISIGGITCILLELAYKMGRLTIDYGYYVAVILLVFGFCAAAASIIITLITKLGSKGKEDGKTAE